MRGGSIMTRLHALTRSLATVAFALPGLALAQGSVPIQQPPPADPAGAWPLGIIVLLVGVVFLVGYLVSRRGRGMRQGE
jgi:hypothetical protein